MNIFETLGPKLRRAILLCEHGWVKKLNKAKKGFAKDATAVLARVGEVSPQYARDYVVNSASRHIRRMDAQAAVALRRSGNEARDVLAEHRKTDKPMRVAATAPIRGIPNKPQSRPPSGNRNLNRPSKYHAGVPGEPFKDYSRFYRRTTESAVARAGNLQEALSEQTRAMIPKNKFAAPTMERVGHEDKGLYPIFDKTSAKSALKLSGKHPHLKREIARRAAVYGVKPEKKGTKYA